VPAFPPASPISVVKDLRFQAGVPGDTATIPSVTVGGADRQECAVEVTRIFCALPEAHGVDLPLTIEQVRQDSETALAFSK